MPLSSDHARESSPFGGLHRSSFSGHLYQKEQTLRERDLSPVPALPQGVASTPMRAHDTSSFGELSSVRDTLPPEAGIRELVAKQDREVWRSGLRECLRKNADSKKDQAVSDRHHNFGSTSSLREWAGTRVENATKGADIDRLHSEVRTVVEAQERLLRVVDCMSSEVTQLKKHIGKHPVTAITEGSVTDRSLLEKMTRTVIELQQIFDQEIVGASGLKAHLAQHDAMLAECRRSQAEEALRFGGMISDMQCRIQGIVAASAVIGGPQNNVSILQQQVARQEAVINDMLQQSAEDRTRLTELSKSSVAVFGESNSSPEALERMKSFMSELEKAVTEDAQQLQLARAEIRKIRSDVDRQEATIAYLQRQDAQLRDVCDLAAQVQQLSEHESAGQKSMLQKCERHAEAGNARVLEELNARQREETSGLRTELWTALQEQETNIKALGEHLWVIDEQLWQTDKRLGDRIDEMSRIGATNACQKTPEDIAISGASSVANEGAFYATILEKCPGAFNESFGEELLGAVSASTEDLQNVGVGSPRRPSEGSQVCPRSPTLFEGPAIKSMPSRLPIQKSKYFSTNSERLLSAGKWCTGGTVADDVAQAAVAAVAAVANNAVHIAEENLKH